MSVQEIIDRQVEVTRGTSAPIPLPQFRKYTMCNLRGGIGKTTLSFNISYLVNNLLVVDTCPQGNLSFFYDNQYYSSLSLSVRDMILPYLVPGLGNATHVATHIGTANSYFQDKQSYFIRSSSDLFLLPSQLITAINQALGLPQQQKESALRSILFSLRDEIDRELRDNHLDKCLVDTSPFFAGATQLAWYATDALIVPVRTDQQSVNSLELLIHTLTSSQGEFRRYLGHLPGNSVVTPKIQMVVLTHCGWSRKSGDQNVPDRQTKLYVQRVYDILSRHRMLLSTENPDNHLLLLDDFLGSGRISSVLSKPIDLLEPGETRTIDGARVAVNESVEKCKNQLRYITQLLW